MGYGKDMVFDKDALTLPELKEAFESSPFKEDNKLAFVGFDACLMQSAEISIIMSDYADYLVASQEVEPSFGWNYSFLGECGKISTKELVEKIPEYYVDYSLKYFEENENTKSDVTLSSIDLSKAKILEEQINKLFAAASENVVGHYNEFAIDRIQARAIGRYTTGSEYDLIDLSGLIDNMDELYPDETKLIKDTLSEMIISNKTNVNELTGLSIYYPFYNKAYYEKSWKNDYENLSVLGEYYNYLLSYEQIWLGTDVNYLFAKELNLESVTEGKYVMNLTDEQKEEYASGNYYILRRHGEELYTAMYTSSNVSLIENQLVVNFDGNVTTFFSAMSERAIPLIIYNDTVDDYERCSVFATLRKDSSNNTDNEESVPVYIKLLRNIETGDAEIESVVAAEVDNANIPDLTDVRTGKKTNYKLNDWGRISFHNSGVKYLRRNAEGIVLPYEEWPDTRTSIWQEFAVSNGVMFANAPLSNDGFEYYIMFEVTDTRGDKYASELLPINVSREEETEKECVEVTGNNGQELLLFDSNGIKIYTSKNTTDAGVEDYCVTIENNGDTDISGTLSYIKANGISDGSVIELSAKKGETTITGTGASKLLQFTDGKLSKLEFEIGLLSSNTGEYITEARSMVKISENVDLHYNNSIKYVQDIGEKELVNQDGMNVTVKHAGYIYDGDELKFHTIVIAQNNSDKDMPVSIPGISIDGFTCNMSMNESNINAITGAYIWSLPAGESYIFDILADDMYIALMQPEEIYSLGYMVSFDYNKMIVEDYTQGDWYYVLGSKSNEATKLEAGDIIYDANDIIIRNLAKTEVDDECYYILSIENNNSNDIEIHLDNVFLNGISKKSLNKNHSYRQAAPPKVGSKQTKIYVLGFDKKIYNCCPELEADIFITDFSSQKILIYDDTNKLILK